MKRLILAALVAAMGLLAGCSPAAAQSCGPGGSGAFCVQQPFIATQSFTAQTGVSITASGAPCDGTTDDTTKLNRWLAGLTPGTTVVIPPGKFCLIDSANLNVPTGIAIVGSGNPFPNGTTNPGQPTGSGFIVNPSYTVSMAPASTLENLGVWRKGLVVNPTSAQVLSAVAAWGADSSTGIWVAPNGGGTVLRDLFVEGFHTGIRISSGRTDTSDIKGDDYNGVIVDWYPGDGSLMHDVQIEPFYAFGLSESTGAFARPGIGVQLAGMGGGTLASRLITFMWANGLVIAGGGNQVTNSSFEWDDAAGNGETDAIGVRVIAATATKMSDVDTQSDYAVMTSAGSTLNLANIRTVSEQTVPAFTLGQETSAETLTVGGSVAAGNVLTVTFTSASIPGSPVSVSYTETASDNSVSAAQGLAEAILETQSLASNRIDAVYDGGTSAAKVYYDAGYTVTFTTSATGGATLTAASAPGIGGTGGSIEGANPLGSFNHMFYIPGNTGSWAISDLAVPSPLPPGWMDYLVPQVQGVALAGIHWSNDTNANLSGAGTSPSISQPATDAYGTVTEGGSATGFTLTFTTPWPWTPACALSSPTGTALTSYSATTTALTVVNPSGSAQEWTYQCRAN